MAFLSFLNFLLTVLSGQTLRETLSGNSTLLSLEFHDVQVAPEGILISFLSLHAFLRSLIILFLLQGLKDFLKGLGESPVLKNLRMARVSFGGSELESVMKLADSSKVLQDKVLSQGKG